MRSSVLTFLLIALTFPILVSGQDSNAKSYSLKEAQAQAVLNNARVKLAALDVNIASETVKSVGANVFPQIGATGSFNHFIDIPTSVVPIDAFGGPPTGSDEEFMELQFGSKYSSSLGLTANQLIFDGSYIIGLKAAKSFVKVQTLALSKTEIEVKVMVTQAYYTVLIAKQNAEILTKNLASVQKTYKEAQELQKNGFIEQTALDQIKLMASNMEISQNTATEQLIITEKLLKFQLGIPLDSPIKLSEELNSLADLGATYAVADQFKPEDHIDFRMAETQIRLMELNKRKEQFTYIPTLGGFFNYSRNAFRNELNFLSGKWYPTTIWGLSLNVPIFGGFGQTAKLKIAGLQLEKAQVQQSQISEGLKLQEASARLGYTSAVSLYQNQKENLELAETIREKTSLKFKEGLASSMELTQAENQFFSTQGAYVQSVFSLLNSYTELQKALGKF